MSQASAGEMKDLLLELRRQEEKLFNCVHCGFCLPACPTYTRLGDEADSPRGRLHLMRAVVEGRLDPVSGAFQEHLDRCLGCRACESVCPSGVEYGRLLEGARDTAAAARPPGLLARALPRVMASRSVLAPLMLLTRALRGSGIPALAAERLPDGGLLGQLRLGLGMVAATRAPGFLGGGGERRAEGRAAPEAERRGGTLGAGRIAGVLTGCVQEGLLARVNRATERVLEANGFRVVAVAGQGCCGAIHAHTGDLEGARTLARRNIGAFEAAGVDVVAVNAAGCGAIMKEYGHLLARDRDFAERAASLAARVRDVAELLGVPGLRSGGRLPLAVTYDAPCHLLHAQKVSVEPLQLLGSIPGLELIPLPNHEECCGGAGIYGITHPDLGGRIGRDKVKAIMGTGAEVLATGNPGCLMQIGAGLKMAGSKIEVAHPVELLDESYRRGGLYRG